MYLILLCAKHYSKQFKFTHLNLIYTFEVDTIINCIWLSCKLRHIEVK